MARFIWLIVGCLESLLALRFIFRLLGAGTNAFTTFLYSVTQPLILPFQGIFPQPSSEGLVLEISALVSMLVIAIIGALVAAWLEAILPDRF